MAISKESLDAIKKIQTDAGNKKIVFVSGNFNIIHPGHLRLLRFAAECGEYLVVGVLPHTSPQISPVPGLLRLEGIDSIGMVDSAFLMKEKPEEFVRALRPSVVVKGKEHESTYNPEKEVLDEYSGSMLFGSGEISFSSSDLIEKEFGKYRAPIIRPAAYLKRHSIEQKTLRDYIERFKALNVTVVGDLIVDEYVHCDPLGMSREDPVIVVSPSLRDKYIGGAGIVAAHTSGLGAKVKFFTVVGKDPAADFAIEKLSEFGVRPYALVDESRPTSVKTRFRVRGNTVFRVSELRQHAISKDLIEKISREIKEALKESHLLIFSDFNYGCLPQPLVDEITACCLKLNVPMVADSQSSSQIGDVSRFKDAAFLTPTEYEARIALKDFDSGLVVLARDLREVTGAKNILLKLGSEGILIHPTAKEESLVTDQLPALNSNPVDVAGAGDSLLSCAALAKVSGANIWESAYLGSLAAAVQVGREGNIPLTPQDLLNELG